ncbi:hypothetical protein EJB05_56649, partial [Eragrostis curvula]
METNPIYAGLEKYCTPPLKDSTLQNQIRCNSDRYRVLHPLPAAASRTPARRAFAPAAPPPASPPASRSTCLCSAHRWTSRRPCSVLGAPVDVAAARRPCPADPARRRPCPADPVRRRPYPSSSTSRLILLPSVATVPALSSQASTASSCSCSSFTLRQLQCADAITEARSHSEQFLPLHSERLQLSTGTAQGDQGEDLASARRRRDGVEVQVEADGGGAATARR